MPAKSPLPHGRGLFHCFISRVKRWFYQARFVTLAERMLPPDYYNSRYMATHWQTCEHITNSHRLQHLQGYAEGAEEAAAKGVGLAAWSDSIGAAADVSGRREDSSDDKGRRKDL